MLSVTAAARAQVQGVRLGWAVYERTGTGGGALPDPTDVVPSRELGTLPEDPVVRAYRGLSWQLGVDPTKQRPAGEALARRVLAGKGLPSILPLVDAYNLASACTFVPLSAFSFDRIEGQVVLDVATGGEAFQPLFKDAMVVDAGRLVWRDDIGVNALFLYCDGERTALRKDTGRALVVATGAPGTETQLLEEAYARLDAFASQVGWAPADGPGFLEV